MSLPRYQASEALEKFLIANAGPHYVCDNEQCYITSLEGLQSFRALHGDDFYHAAIPVYPRASDSPFSVIGDAAYQAYHDRQHALGGYQFDMAGEYRLACAHYTHAKRCGLSEEDALALYYFVCGRVEFMYRHNGEEPPCRATFLTACFRHGRKAAARGDYLLQYADLHS